MVLSNQKGNIFFNVNGEQYKTYITKCYSFKSLSKSIYIAWNQTQKLEKFATKEIPDQIENVGRQVGIEPREIG